MIIAVLFYFEDCAAIGTAVCKRSLMENTDVGLPLTGANYQMHLSEHLGNPIKTVIF